MAGHGEPRRGAVCPWCHRFKPLRKDGTFYMHHSRGTWDQCDGSHRGPDDRGR